MRVMGWCVSSQIGPTFDIFANEANNEHSEFLLNEVEIRPKVADSLCRPVVILEKNTSYIENRHRTSTSTVIISPNTVYFTM